MNTITRKRPPPAHLWHHNAVKDHCIRGHPFDEENTYRRSDGTRCCRRCKSERQRGNI